MNHDDQTNLPPDDDQQSSVEEIAGLFNEIAETVAEFITPGKTEFALQNLFDRLNTDPSNRAEWAEPRKGPTPIPPTKITQQECDKAEVFLPGCEATPRRDLHHGQTRRAANHAATGTNQASPEVSDHTSTDSMPATGTIVPRHAGATHARRRHTGHAASSTVDILELLAVPGRDLRILSHDDRQRTWSLVTGMRELLSAYPAGRFGAPGSAMVLEAVAAVSEALIADRNERTAVRLMRAGSPHLQVLGRHDQRGFRVRRAWAEAWSELGYYRMAERLLRRLRGDEQRIKNSADPRTEMLLLWTLVGRDQLPQAAEGFQTLNTSLVRAQEIDISTLGHLECRGNWVLGQQGLVEESAKGYGRVIEGRSTVLGPDDSETLDARHSLGKMLVLNSEGAQAIPLLESLLKVRKSVLGERHPDTLETSKYLCLAGIQAELRNDRALAWTIEELQYILRAQAESHGLGHPMTRDTAARLRHIQETPMTSGRPCP
ncbi:tetratricopeptide repeat protein [Nocardia sp. NPDC005366]|uniref:tetratricopeptide repeat protein n=1 Tax=Nocardia sp. NPDC005366 TaxID=3156878 RepID=UPI0033B2A3D7